LKLKRWNFVRLWKIQPPEVCSAWFLTFDSSLDSSELGKQHIEKSERLNEMTPVTIEIAAWENWSSVKNSIICLFIVVCCYTYYISFWSSNDGESLPKKTELLGRNGNSQNVKQDTRQNLGTLTKMKTTFFSCRFGALCCRLLPY
jgi:hypothetical protein